MFGVTNIVVRCPFKGGGVKGFGLSACAPFGVLLGFALHKMPVQVVPPPPSPDELPDFPQQSFCFAEDQPP